MQASIWAQHQPRAAFGVRGSGGSSSSILRRAAPPAAAAPATRALQQQRQHQRQWRQLQQQQQRLSSVCARAAPGSSDASADDDGDESADSEQPQPEQPPQQRPARRQHNMYELLNGPSSRGGGGSGSGSSLDGGPGGGRPKVGAEYGEGFQSYLPAGGVMRVDVDALNESLRVKGALRLRHSMRPDEAVGVVVNFDSIVADLYAVRAEAWRALAAARGLPLSERHLSHPELHAAPPEVAAVRVLRWADSMRGGRELAYEHAGLAARALAAQAAPRPGVRQWLDTLGRFNVPCALVSALDGETVRASLARMALHDHFSALVAAEDEHETPAQRLLSASLKLRRPPNMCVAVEATPEGVTAAHNVTMRAIAVKGPYAAYELRGADLTCGSLAELSVYNIRRLFANRGQELMDVQQQADWQQWDGPRRRNSRRRLGIATGP